MGFTYMYLLILLVSLAQFVACQRQKHSNLTMQTDTLYTVHGSIDVFTYENTVFYWHGVMYNLENIPCKYWDHVSCTTMYTGASPVDPPQAGIWDPSWGNNSYARIRELDSGRVVANVSSTKGFGFISAFPDYEVQRPVRSLALTTGQHDTLWLFGTPANR